MSLSHRVVFQEPRGGSQKPLTALVQSSAELAALELRGELPSDALAHGPLAVISLGQQPTAAHSVELRSVEPGSAPDEAVVRYVHRTDGPPADVITYPVLAIALPPGTRRCRFERA